MHADEVPIDAALVRRLLAAQFPRWADLPLERVASAGTDNAIFRLGDERAVRLPRIGWASGQVDKEARWLAYLAPHLPLALPETLAVGEPGEGYPWRWAICRWLDGENATFDRLSDPTQAARDLAGFVRALQSIATDGGPVASDTFARGVPLAQRDAATRASIAALNGQLDIAAATAAWDSALQAPLWSRAPVWLHGDLQSGNLLCRDGLLTGVIDFGCLGVGDPAAELIVAWNLFDTESRAVFREALAVDDATWERGRGWALSVALIALPYYLHTNPQIVTASRRTIGEVLRA